MPCCRSPRDLPLPPEAKMAWLQCGSSMVAMRAADAEACQMGQTLSRNYTRWNFRSNTQAHANANALLLKHTNTNK